MFKRVAIFVFIGLVLNTNPQPYFSLSTQGINFGIIKSRIDYGFGLDFRAQYNNYHSESIFNTTSGNDTIYSINTKTKQFVAGPEVSIGYYFTGTKLKPFIQAYSETLFPIYSSYEFDNKKNGYFKNIDVTGGLIGGIEYLIDNKISIGSGIGPYIAYDYSENSVNKGDKSTSKSIYLWVTSNFHFRYYF